MVTAIVAAAGKGRRFGAPENKVFAPLAGRTVLHWTLAGLAACADVDAVVVVTGADDLERVREIASPFAGVHAVCEGGAERYDSVWNALLAVPAGTELVAVHDGARPLATPALISSVIAAARATGAALPATPVSDTVKRSADGVETRETVDRRELYAVQTPQVFAYDLLRQAYESARTAGFGGTDDASYVERLGHPVRLVPGERNNLKITVAEDLQMAEALLGGPSIRTGFGYDVHRLVPGRRLVLGGVELEHPEGLGLDGHSDADVLLHALADALLGAAGLGDIGEHFPNTDARFQGISSLVLLRVVHEKVREAGWEVSNVDSMLLAERPKIRPFVDLMRARIAEALEVRADQVGVKATTNERLGFEGREEGIAAHAVATLRRR
ncbi:MAG TPA: 2-C-methyl-D-erythritol 4-phosphate cytidylyltransferase [Armatimonadota bacterium]|nr:2-C-methyl-D-erythritol 4-phosphate cytidylyltransferase [Armatimonadota bacterium]